VAGALERERALLQRGTLVAGGGFRSRAGRFADCSWGSRPTRQVRGGRRTELQVRHAPRHQRVHCGLDAEMGWRGSSWDAISGGSSDLQTVAQRFELRSVNWASSKVTSQVSTMTPESSRTRY
jgi:hypothetical protein